MSSVAPDNAEATEAWSGPLFDVFLKYRDLTTGGLGAHGEVAMGSNPPRPGERGCQPRRGSPAGNSELRTPERPSSVSTASAT